VTGTRLVLLAWALLGIGNGLHTGTYAHGALAWVCVAVLLLSLPVLAPSRFPLSAPQPVELWLAVLVAALVFVPMNGPVQHISAQTDVLKARLLVAIVVALALTVRSGRTRVIAGAVFLAVCAVLGGLAISVETPPHIDVWYLTRGAADSIVNGTDMYVDHFPDSTGIKDAFPYLPALGVLLAPLRLVGLDVRYGMLLSALVAAVLVWRLAPRGRGPLLALLVIVVPGWITLMQLSWNEPLLLALLAGLFLAVERGHVGWAVVLLAVALATKQHVLLICPVLALWPAFGLRRVVLAGTAAAAFVLPWFLVAPHSFLRGALYLNLDLEPRPDSLSLFTLATEQGWRPPFALVGGLTLLAIAAVVVPLRRRPDAAMAALASAWVLAVFHLLNKQSFYNEWWLVITLAVVGLALVPEPQETPVTALA
jgi:hypothetical protein